MKKILYLFVFALTSSLLLFSCNEGSVGSSISQSNINIAMDSSFSVSGKSVPNEKIPARVINQLLGLIKAKNYGTLTSDYVTEFMPVTDFDDEGMSLETIDSVKLARADARFGISSQPNPSLSYLQQLRPIRLLQQSRLPRQCFVHSIGYQRIRRPKGHYL